MEAKRLSGDLGDPSAKEWGEAPREQLVLAAVPLAAQPSRYVRAAWADCPYGVVCDLTAQAAHDGKRLYICLEWVSPTLEAKAQGGDSAPHPIEGPDAFYDAVAAMFPVNGEASLETMGSDTAPVNVWRWSAGALAEAEDLTVRGIGTVEPTGGGNGLVARSEAGDAAWRLVLARSLKPKTKEGSPLFAPGKARQVAFAVWTGANQERAGIKSASQAWSELKLEK